LQQKNTHLFIILIVFVMMYCCDLS